MATDTMFEFMGIRVDPVEEPIGASLNTVTTAAPPAGRVAAAQSYIFDGRLNDSFRAVNLLLDKGVPVRRTDTGDFVVSANPALVSIAARTGVSFDEWRGTAAHEVKRLRVAMYQRYRGGNMDEGWTRLLLEQFGFPYTTALDADVKKGGLRDRFDLLILPDDSTAAITGERPPNAPRIEEQYPPEYRSGIGEDGVKGLKEFVEKGGTLVTLGSAGDFAIEKLGVGLRNVVSGRSTKEFWCPGSTLHAFFDNTHALAHGMPKEGLVLYLSGNPVFEIAPSARNERYEVIVRYAARDLLESGWLVGEQALVNKAAVVSASMGEGRVILFGMRPQHRAQTHGTFKLLFNALLR
jgi:hypothetical protein